MASQRKEIPTYWDGSEECLELHAMRAPVGGYRDDVTDEEWNGATEDAVRRFEERLDVQVRLLGRSGRHVCIEDHAENRRRYWNLRRAAIAAAKALWAEFRQPAKV